MPEGIDLPRLCACSAEEERRAPIFRRMLTSHQHSLVAARDHHEPAGQIAAREMEIVRIKGAFAQGRGIER